MGTVLVDTIPEARNVLRHTANAWKVYCCGLYSTLRTCEVMCRKHEKEAWIMTRDGRRYDRINFERVEDTTVTAKQTGTERVQFT